MHTYNATQNSTRPKMEKNLHKHI